MRKMEKRTVWIDIAEKATAAEVELSDVTWDGVAADSSPRATISPMSSLNNHDYKNNNKEIE